MSLPVRRRTPSRDQGMQITASQMCGPFPVCPRGCVGLWGRGAIPSNATFWGGTHESPEQWVQVSVSCSPGTTTPRHFICS